MCTSHATNDSFYKYLPQQPYSVLFQRRDEALAPTTCCTYDFNYHHAISENDAQNIPQALTCPAVAIYLHV